MNETVYIKLHTDSNPAKMTVMKRGAGRMKHMEIRYLAVQQWVKDGRLTICKIHTDVNPADLMTKAMTVDKMTRHGRALRMQGGPFVPDPGG